MSIVVVVVVLVWLTLRWKTKQRERAIGSGRDARSPLRYYGWDALGVVPRIVGVAAGLWFFAFWQVVSPVLAALGAAIVYLTVAWLLTSFAAAGHAARVATTTVRSTGVRLWDRTFDSRERWVELTQQWVGDRYARLRELLGEFLAGYRGYEARWGSYEPDDERLRSSSPSNVRCDPSPYEVLGVNETASHDEIRRRYRDLARRLHPDAHPRAGSRERARLEERMKVVNAAYAVLEEIHRTRAA